MIGEMCPQAAAGRPAVAPLVMRKETWIDAAPELANVVERGSVPRFVVFGVDGKPAGAFDTMGLADIGLTQAVAAGSYVGGAPCSKDAGGGQRTDDPKCVAATRGCGIAVGELARPDDPPPSPRFGTGGACLSGESIAVDIDGDGAMELFPIASVLDGARSPSAEWTASPVVGASCTPQFQLLGLQVKPPADGKPVEAKHLVGLDVLGVVDLDGDGRRELVIALAFPTVRTIAIYTATGSAQRLELAGEAQAFQR